MPRIINDQTVRDAIKTRVKQYGIKTVAEAAGFSPAYMQYLIRGSKPITKKVAKVFGYELIKTTTVTYRKIH